MKILMVVPHVPYPPTWGAAVRNYQIVKHLSRSHQLCLLTSQPPEAPVDRVAIDHLRGLGIELVIVPARAPAGKRLAQVASIPTTRSHLGRIFHTAAMQRELDRLVADSRFDVVLLEQSLLARLVIEKSTPVVLDEHNVEFRLLQRMSVTERSTIRRAFALVEFAKFKREELAASRRADWCTFTSSEDLRFMRSVAHLRAAAVVPNGVDLEHYRPRTGEVDHSNVVFTGNFAYRPNVDAVLYFVHDVLPSILKGNPAVTFTIVGAEPPQEVSRLEGKAVRVTGRVADVREYLGRAAVAVAPIRFGGGTRLKILEAMGMARPVVTTTVGCEGIDAIPGEHALIAETPEAFADSVLKLLSEPILAERVGTAGRRLVEAKYGWDAAATLMAEVLELAAARATPRQPTSSEPATWLSAERTADA